ncbi:MAG TPA: lamin tail domain-containing protein [Nocardioidaceae bacterium]|nr:lamin tail domain-containing protein [Nocardioidaceae bacterium]
MASRKRVRSKGGCGCLTLVLVSLVIFAIAGACSGGGSGPRRQPAQAGQQVAHAQVGPVLPHRRRRRHRRHAHGHRAKPTATRPARTEAAQSGPAATGSTMAALSRLPVKGRAPMTGYDRALFGPAWTDDVDVPFGHNGCDTRNDVLRRDLVDTVIEPGTYGCVVSRGLLDDPYSANAIHFVRGWSTSILVEIDHVVALGDAWQTGAQRWSAGKRADFANDPLELLAVDEHNNEQKGDSDAASWLPPNTAFRCRYVAIQVAVKAKYGLWVTGAEHDAMASVLSHCPRYPLPAEPGGHGTVAVHATAPPPPAPTTSSSTSAPPPGSSSGRVAFVGVEYDPSGDDNYELDSEWIELRNGGSGSVSLAGWRISDASIHTFAFPAGFTLPAGGTVRVHTGSGRDTATDLYWGEGSAVWNNDGDTATLRNGSGATVATCRYGGGGSYASC